LGVSINSLRRLGIGWSKDHKAWTFPMGDARGRVTGIRLRLPSGRKLSIKGSKEGLFLPDDLHAGGRLLIAEGPTDTAALLDLGFDAVGRPSCTGGTKHIVALAKRLKPVEIAIVADGDGPGQRGADRLAVALLAYVPIVRVVIPPPGVKDARDWKRAGATAADVHLAIGAATPKTLKIRVSPKHEKASLRSRP
jgi:DNA primase